MYCVISVRIWRNGRRVGLRIQWATVQVQVLLSAPKTAYPLRVGFFVWRRT